jgi:hypothetical protein
LASIGKPFFATFLKLGSSMRRNGFVAFSVARETAASGAFFAQSAASAARAFNPSFFCQHQREGAFFSV